jgi:hypothetical protein
MATNCDACGHRSNEVKSGGGIKQKGLRIEVKIKNKDDFNRDVLKVSVSLNLLSFILILSILSLFWPLLCCCVS